MGYGGGCWRDRSVENDGEENPATSPAAGYASRESSDEATGTEAAMEPSLNISARWITRGLVFAAILLTLASIVVGTVALLEGPFVRLFYVGSDLSVPAWYSALVLALASILLFTVAFVVGSGEDPRYARRWAILGIIFAYLSCDEMLRLHERIASTLIVPAIESLGFVPGSILYYPWVLIYTPLVILFALAYFRFWRELPERTRILFLAAGTIFVCGALGVELFNAYHDAAGGREPLVIAGTHLEEFMEMVGIVIFVHAILSYIGSHLNIRALRLCFEPGR